LEELFLTYGFPREIVSDHGRQFLREFEEWCEEKFISHRDRKSSPYNHEANGHAEAGVKAMKALLEKTGGFGREFAEALLHYRNLPRSDGKGSPAEIFLGRKQRRGIPEPSHVQGRELRSEQTIHGGRSLRPLVVGEAVRLQNPLTGRWDAVGTVTGQRSTGRSYFVQRRGESKSILRNRRFLKPLPASEEGDGAREALDVIQPQAAPRRSPRLQLQHGSGEVQARSPAQGGGGGGDIKWLSCV
jgi:hypothetical protein